MSTTPVARICLNVAARGRRFMGYQPEHPLRMVYSYEPFSLGPDGPELTDEDICEQAFYLFNAPEEYLTPAEREVTTAYRAGHNRSLSVGDVVFVQRGASLTAYACASMGWQLVEGEPRLVQEVPVN